MEWTRVGRFIKTTLPWLLVAFEEGDEVGYVLGGEAELVGVEHEGALAAAHLLDLLFGLGLRPHQQLFVGAHSGEGILRSQLQFTGVVPDSVANRDVEGLQPLSQGIRRLAVPTQRKVVEARCDGRHLPYVPHSIPGCYGLGLEPLMVKGSPHRR